MTQQEYYRRVFTNNSRSSASRPRLSHEPLHDRFQNIGKITTRVRNNINTKKEMIEKAVEDGRYHHAIEGIIELVQTLYKFNLSEEAKPILSKGAEIFKTYISDIEMLDKKKISHAIDKYYRSLLLLAITMDADDAKKKLKQWVMKDEFTKTEQLSQKIVNDLLRTYTMLLGKKDPRIARYKEHKHELAMKDFIEQKKKSIRREFCIDKEHSVL